MSGHGETSDEHTEPDPDCVPTRSTQEESTADTLPKGVASAADHTLAPGTMLGDYRVEVPVARGATGTVYAATHPQLGKRAAVKLLAPELCRDHAALTRFFADAQALGAIGHANLVEVFAVGRADAGSYVVMEWLVGESLADRLERVGALAVEDACAIARSIAGALRAAHQRGMIHRGLRPASVFLAVVPGEPPRVKLLDLGIAQLIRPRAASGADTLEGAMVSTVTYAPPEQQRGEDIDHRVDCYALGAVMFELIVGRPPFVADTPIEVVAKHLMEPPPRLSAFVGVPRDLDQLVDALLAKDPAERADLDAVLAVVDHYLPASSARASRTAIVAEPAAGSERASVTSRPPISAEVAAPQVATAAATAPVAAATVTVPAAPVAPVAVARGPQEAPPWSAPPPIRSLRVGPPPSRGELSIPRIVAAIVLLVGLVATVVWATQCRGGARSPTSSADSASRAS